MNWRVGGKINLNLYEGDRPVCQCHNPTDPARLADAMNRIEELTADREYVMQANIANEWLDRYRIQEQRIQQLAREVDAFRSGGMALDREIGKLQANLIRRSDALLLAERYMTGDLNHIPAANSEEWSRYIAVLEIVRDALRP